MTTEETLELIAELRKGDGNGCRQPNELMRAAADALAALTAPEEARAFSDGKAASDYVCERAREWARVDFPSEKPHQYMAGYMRGVANHVAPPAPQEGDVREHLHAKCDCVPDLGPAHCHLCGNEKGEPVPWPECSAVRAAVPDAATEQDECALPGHAGCTRVMVDGEPWVDHFPAEEMAQWITEGKLVQREVSRGPWLPVPGGEGKSDDQA